jgi:multiple sugar transport system ATP-binding protein
MADLLIQGVAKSFGDVQALSDLDLDIKSGEFIVLLGPSGAGKTTTLRLVAGLEAPDRGQIHIGGRDVTHLAPALRDVTFVFQQYSLYPHLTVFENMAFPLRSPMRPTPEVEIRKKVEEVARMLRIEDKLQNPATRLSGGQMQRVAIGRALVRSPALYLMDEPLSSLDAKLRNDLRLELKRIQQDLGATMLYVTHDQTEALTMATRVGVLQEGRLIQLGTPRQIYEDPCSSYVASRLGAPRINLLARSVLADLAAPVQASMVGVRSEHVILTTNSDQAFDAAQASAAQTSTRGKGVQAHVLRVEHLSDQCLVHLNIDGTEQDLVSACSSGANLQPGDPVRIHLQRAFWFDAVGQRIYA